MTKFFWKDVPLNADIERHRAQQKELEAKIAMLESGEQTKHTEGYLRTYRHLLCQLLQSKAEVVAKIGKKK